MSGELKLLKPGTHFLMGNIACAEAALIAGCEFYAGYPITPSNEIAEHMSRRMPELGRHFIQMEDEIASAVAILGASAAGVKSMTATSGPGFSLMMESIGLSAMLELPCVIVDVQRAGPSTGIPTFVGQGDVMQSRWGSHGDYELVVYAPSSVQEFFDLTIEAFNTSEWLRIPTIVLSDEVVGHMYGRLEVPPYDKITIINRKKYEGRKEDYLPYNYETLIPPFVAAGEGYRIHMTGLTHDERGYPSLEIEDSHKLLERLVMKVRKNAKNLWKYESYFIDDADIVVITFGITARASIEAVKRARKEGLKIGLLKLLTLWPFPEDPVKIASQYARRILVAEINMGQLIHPVREVAECPVASINYPVGYVPPPEYILDGIRAAV
ncbi:MAG: 2-oxoacid:acceptor oxidoreductase subunit alpha [Aigarchaeota archaeon]|nr:2-oxoacid:acceptor oxidoreductase subunit alpha [Aigarchaeota archaeon]MCX8193298.1 2-oxoacid:acceptor oxidoreductase subunit alpha [Nitrososphaeria archaeon]MDW7986517.1 2-oxoacid:acceptor oxidoreductase subunit alpha [Nitrososphaerota archaeon]